MSEGFSVSSAIFKEQFGFPGTLFHVPQSVDWWKREHPLDECYIDSSLIVRVARIKNSRTLHGPIVSV
jgi:hypothetical protein